MALIFDSNTKQKPQIDYPAKWRYKLIGRDKKQLKACIKEIMGDKKHKVIPGNSSKTGKFHTLNTECKVADQNERDQIFKAFQEHDAVQMVF